MPTVFERPEDLLEAVGRKLGTSDWLEITQDRVDRFADATGDRQWIHVDPERAREGPFGTTIAHGYLTLSLVNLFLPRIVEVRGVSMGVNYGADRLRFPAPVPVGSRIRGVAELLEAERTRDGGVQAKVRVTVEVEGGSRPACVVDTLSRYYPAEGA
jgi:acyl dehydratase